ncbi:cytochrome P450 [Schizophyllum commune Loenen D]|nr:cytochrome P450 [Schizophyllum commune Loenen D]
MAVAEALLYLFMSCSNDSIAAVVFGVVLHTHYRRSEPKVLVFLLHSLVPGVCATVKHLFMFDSEGATTVTIPGAIAYAARFLAEYYYVSMSASVLAYRISPFHPLAAFPGPKSAAASKWWSFYRLAVRGQRHIDLQRHASDYALYTSSLTRIQSAQTLRDRSGPNELSIDDPSAISAIYEGLERAAFYQAIPANGISLINILDRQMHQKRRRAWNSAFTPSCLEGYANSVNQRLLQLLERMADEIRQSPTGGIQIDRWTEDITGDIGFLGGFETIKEETHKDGWDWFSTGEVPWVKNFMEMPTAAKLRRVRELQEATTRTSIMSKVLSKSDENSLELRTVDVIADAMLTIIAAAGSTSFVIQSLLYDLSLNPLRMRRIQEEVDPLFEKAILMKLPYLSACVDKVLRLTPPLAWGPPRTTGPQGAMICGRFVPPNTNISVPIYAMQRDVRNFGPLAEKFIPERWLPSDQAYIPFSAGYGRCPGRALGLQNAKIAVATILHNYSLAPEESFDPAAYEASFRDNGVWTRDALKLRFSPRQ